MLNYMVTLMFYFAVLTNCQCASARTQDDFSTLGWSWEGDNASIPHSDNGVIEELVTIRLDANSSCAKAIDEILEKLPFIDTELSYETIYDNGTRTLTVVSQVGGSSYVNGNEDRRAFSESGGEPGETASQEKTVGERGLNKQDRNKLKNLQPGKVLIDPVTAQKNPFSSTARVSCGRFCPWSCTGVLVGNQHVLTAAHCIYKERLRHLQVGFMQRSGLVNWYSAQKFYVSHNWRKKRSAYDYALIKLNSSPGRPALKMQSSVLSRRTPVSFSAFDKGLKMRVSSCQTLTQRRDVIVTRCEAVKGNSGAGLLVKNSKYDHIVVGVLSSRAKLKPGSRRFYYIATKLNRKKIGQITKWIRKS